MRLALQTRKPLKHNVAAVGLVASCLKSTDFFEGPANGQLRVRYESDEFVFPARDVCLLPIVHSSAEELARYIWNQLTDALRTRDALAQVTVIEISVAEGPGQSAIYRSPIPPP